MFVLAYCALSIYSRQSDSRSLHRFDAVKEVGGLGNIVAFAAGQTKASQIAQPIDPNVNLSTQGPTRITKTLLTFFWGAPTVCWCARTMVLSRNTHSESAPSQKVLISARQTPLSAQREKRLSIACEHNQPFVNSPLDKNVNTL